MHLYDPKIHHMHDRFRTSPTLGLDTDETQCSANMAGRMGCWAAPKFFDPVQSADASVVEANFGEEKWRLT